MGEGIVFGPLKRLRTTLGDCDEFQKWTGNPGSSASAIARIHYGSLPQPAGAKYTREELDRYRPFCILSQNQNAGFGVRRTAAVKTWQPRGVVLAHFEMTTPSHLRDEQATLDEEILTTIGRIVARPDSEASSFNGLLNLFHDPAGDYLAADDVNVLGPFRSNKQQHPGEGDFLYWLFEVSWGVAS